MFQCKIKYGDFAKFKAKHCLSNNCELSQPTFNNLLLEQLRKGRIEEPKMDASAVRICNPVQVLRCIANQEPGFTRGFQNQFPDNFLKMDHYTCTLAWSTRTLLY